jgi:cytochrome c biogenesis protein CcdA
MIGEITPLVKVAGRMTWLRASLAHVVGSIGSAAVLGLMLATVGVALVPETMGRVPALLGGLVLLLCGLRDAGIIRVRLPSLTRQTPRWFRRQFAPTWYALLWGIDLGQGWTTRILYSGYYGLVGWVLLQHGLATGALVMGCYGLGRGLPVVIVGTAQEQEFADIMRWPVFRQPALQTADAFALAVASTIILSALLT